MSKLTVHMIGNAHLDPVWLWRKSAGIDEAIATCRTACDLLDEYTHRYGKKHLSGEKLRDILATPPKNIPKTPWVDPPPAMKAYPQCIVEGNIVESYRNYYRVAKRDFAKWTKRQTPEWYHYGN